MRTPRKRPGMPGYVSYALVITTGMMLTVMTLFAYRRATQAQAVQSSVQLRMDYSEKEDAVMRSIVAIAPNRAMRAMQHSSAAAGANRDSLRWQSIFTEAMAQANAATSVSAELRAAIGQTAAVSGNTGDSALGTTDLMFSNVHGAANNTFITPGVNRNLGDGFPPALNSVNSTVNTNDLTYPIISNDKEYGSYASGKVGLPVATYKKFNLVRYPNIHFGYANPGDMFVAKRNWWAFSLDMADHDDNLTLSALSRRNFVFSIYEVPSQLAISSAAFMSLGRHGDSSSSLWQNVSIEGNIFAGKAQVESGVTLGSLASRRTVEVGGGATIGGQSFAGSPFAPGLREQYEIQNVGNFPVSLPSESGRAAFIPISRGEDFFDRYSDANHAAESNTLSTTTWNNYSSGAMQCAMRLDIKRAVSATNATPTQIQFEYMRGSSRHTYDPNAGSAPSASLPPGYVKVCDENQSYTFNKFVDVAYGAPGGFYFKANVSGTIPFNNTAFGDPLVGTVKGGYYRERLSLPWEVGAGPGGKICVFLYPERLPKFLSDLGADGPEINNSICVNADYRTTGSNVRRPSFPSTQTDYGLILTECSNLSPFTKGFSVVTNFRLYVGSDFNTTATTRPTNYSLSGTYYPPCSLFAPEKRFGVEANPYSISLAGQIGSLAADSAENPVKPLDTYGMDDQLLPPSQNTINLKPIKDPADVPPITMMNWLVVLEERRREFW